MEALPAQSAVGQAVSDVRKQHVGVRRRLTCSLAPLVCLIVVGCTGAQPRALRASFAQSSEGPREFSIFCRPQVLKLDDGTRSPGVVTQVFLTGGDKMSPLDAPEGEFSFRAFDAATDKEVTTWTFSRNEIAKHRIDHSLGPCYVFWLPLEPAETPIRRLVVHGRLVYEGQEISSMPIRVAVPGK